MTRRFLLVSAAAVLFGAGCHQRVQAPEAAAKKTAVPGAQKFNCSGIVTDAAGKPLAGATVEYWHYEGNRFMAVHAELKKKITTRADGQFVFQVSRESGILLARKTRLAPAWKQMNQQYGSGPGADEHLVLTPPTILAGVVLDNSNQPVAHAKVCVAMATSDVSTEEGGWNFNYLSGEMARACFAGRTDASGHFRIENFPTNAAASLTVVSPGKVLREPPRESIGFDSLPWRAGQQDIKLIVEPAGGIAGRIVAAGNPHPLPLARLTLQPDGPGFFSFDERKPVSSLADGSFQFSDVAAGSYRVKAEFGTNAVPEWVADTVPVSVESGQTNRGVEVTAVRGGFLEVTVLGEKDRKPMAKVGVSAYKQNFQSGGQSGSNGIALLRLLPGDYQVSASRESMSGMQNQTAASVEDGKTNKVEIEITPPHKIAGIVRRPDGQPAAELPVRVIGAGYFNPRGDAKTDANGKFEMEWSPRAFGQNDTTSCILIRDVDHDLAVAQDIDEDTGPLDLKLAPGLTLAGSAVCDGKPITNASATLIFWTGRSGSHLPRFSRAAKGPGRFEIAALPPGRKYGLLVSAPGYGQKADYNVAAADEPGRMELDPYELKLANLKLSGQVLDADDKPVSGAQIMLNGDGQPNGNSRSDREGRFHFDHVCDGVVRLFVNARNSFANASAEGGDTNVVLHLGQRYNNSPDSKAHKLKGTVTDATGKPAAGAQVAVFPSFEPQWTKTASNGVFSLTWSVQPWQMRSGEAMLVVRDPAGNQGATMELPEDTTNLDVKMKPALTVTGRVQDTGGSPLASAQVDVQIKAGGNGMYNRLSDQETSVDSEGRYAIKCLPADAHYLIIASAKGHGKSQQQIDGEAETNRMELSPFALKLADRVVAGQILNEDEKPVAGAHVNLNGEGQPDGNMSSDGKGRFHFQVCEGEIHLFANSPQGAGFGQATAKAGDTNIVLTLNSQPGSFPRPAKTRASLKGSPLPDLTGVNLTADAASATQPVLLCLFDAGQRSSRHIVRQLDGQAAALRQKGISVMGIQAAVTTDAILNDWKTASPVSFPLGRVTGKSEKSKWASSVPALPWFILTDVNHRVVTEGFPIEELDAQIKILQK